MNEKTTGFQDKLMKYMMPIANWVEKNNWLQAIKDGMIADIPVIIIGSIFLLPIALNNFQSSRRSSLLRLWQRDTVSTIHRPGSRRSSFI